MSKPLYLEVDVLAVLDPVNDLIVELKSRIDDLEEEVSERDKEIAELAAQVTELENA